MAKLLPCLLFISVMSPLMSRVIETPTEIEEHIKQQLDGSSTTTEIAPTRPTKRNLQPKLVEYSLDIEMLQRWAPSWQGGRLVFQFASRKRSVRHEIDRRTLTGYMLGNRIPNVLIPIKYRDLRFLNATFYGDMAMHSLTIGRVALKPMLTPPGKNSNARCAYFSHHPKVQALPSEETLKRPFEYCNV
ncbi:hypothetical protein HDE_10050 [Halotydeus destructor]|nr:hypothetical protein HDE_10050 [Halotydeus destructor]